MSRWNKYGTDENDPLGPRRLDRRVVSVAGAIDEVRDDVAKIDKFFYDPRKNPDPEFNADHLGYLTEIVNRGENQVSDRFIGTAIELVRRYRKYRYPGPAVIDTRRN